MTVKVDTFRKVPTYEEVLAIIEADKDKLKLPKRIGLTFLDSFAYGQMKDLLAQDTAAQAARGDYNAMDHAMGMAASEEGINKAELLGFM